MCIAKKIILVAVIIIFHASTVFSKEPFKEPQVEYSADVYTTTGPTTLKSTVFYAPGKKRTEIEGGMTTIERSDKKLIWLIFPDGKMYMEQNIEDDTVQRDERFDISDYEIEHSVVGEDTIEGLKTTKYKIVMRERDGNKFTGFMWVTKHDIIVKMDTVSTVDGRKVAMKMALKNIKIKNQDSKLFEIPAGYSKMSGMEDYLQKMREGEDKHKDEEQSDAEKDSGRSYTSQPREEGRSYTAEPRKGRSYTAESREPGTLEKVLPEPLKKFKGWFGK